VTRKKTFSLLLLTSSLPLCALDKSTSETATRWDQRCFLEARASYFRPESKRLREIYHQCWADYQLLLGYEPGCKINLIGTVNLMQESGKTIGGRNHTTILVIPLGLEVRYRYWSSSHWDLYAGIGPRYYFLKVHDHSPDMRRHISRQGWGGVAETGALWTPHHSFFLDLFLAYSYQKMGPPSLGDKIEGLSVTLGGLEAGGGIGWRF